MIASPRRVALLLLVFTSVVSAGCTGRAPFQPLPAPLRSPVEITVMLPLSGDDPHLARGLQAVVRLAASRLNDTLGPLDRRVEPVFVDAGPTPGTAQDRLRALQEQGARHVVAPPLPFQAAALIDGVVTQETLLVVPDGGQCHPTAAPATVVYIVPPAAGQGAAMLLDARDERRRSGLPLRGVAVEGAAPPGEWWVARNFLAQARALGLPELPPDEADIVLAEFPPDRLDNAVAELLDAGPEGSWVVLPAGLRPGDLSPAHAARLRLGGLPIDESLDTGLAPSAIGPDTILSTLRTYDAFVVAALAARRQPDADAPALARWLATQPGWQRARGFTRLRPLPLTEALAGRPFALERP